MRFTLALFSLLAAVSAASGALIPRQNIPNCALSCWLNAKTGSCGENDACLCKDQAFINATTVCLTNACSGNDLANAEAYAVELCREVGVTLTPLSATATATPSTTSARPTTSSSSGGAPSTGGVSVFAGAAAALAIVAVL